MARDPDLGPRLKWCQLSRYPGSIVGAGSSTKWRFRGPIRNLLRLLCAAFDPKCVARRECNTFCLPLGRKWDIRSSQMPREPPSIPSGTFGPSPEGKETFHPAIVCRQTARESKNHIALGKPPDPSAALHRVSAARDSSECL